MNEESIRFSEGAGRGRPLGGEKKSYSTKKTDRRGRPRENKCKTEQIHRRFVELVPKTGSVKNFNEFTNELRF